MVKLAFLYKTGESFDRFFDRIVLRNASALKQVELLGASQFLQNFIHAPFQVLRPIEI